MRKIIIILLIFLTTACTKQLLIKNYPHKAPSYPMFGKVTERSFYYDVDLPDSLDLKWENSAKGSFGINSVVIEDRYVFATDLAGNIFCYDVDTSKVIGADKGSGEIAIAPLLNNGYIYYITTISEERYSRLINYDIRKGERKKELEIPGRVGNEMLLLDDALFFVTDDGYAFRYNFYFQKEFEIDLEENVYSSPASTKNRIYIAGIDGNIFCLDYKSGEIIYKSKLTDRFESAIVIFDNVGFVGDANGNLIAFDLSDGSEIWKAFTGGKLKAPAVHNKQYIYAANLAGSMYCFDIETGEKIWSYDSDGIFNNAGALFNNVLLQPDFNRKLLFINPIDGTLIKTLEYETRIKMNPVYFDKMLYIGIDRGELLAYKCVSEIE